jgi:hypothetical protein
MRCMSKENKKLSQTLRLSVGTTQGISTLKETKIRAREVAAIECETKHKVLSVPG